MELAGFLEANDRLGRVVDSGDLLPPSWACIEQGKIHWKDDGRWVSVMGGRFRSRLIRPPADLLDRFTSLWNADDSEILAFAKAYGTLRRPIFHGRPLLKSDFEGREPLSQWRALSQHASDLLQIGAALRAEENLGFDRWAQLLSADRALSTSGKAHAFDNYRAIRAIIRQHRVPEQGVLAHHFAQTEEAFAAHAVGYLDAEISAWNARFGPVSFGIAQDSRTPAGWRTAFSFGYSMVCYVGFQLMLVMVGGDAFTCSACGMPYIRPRGRNAPSGFRKAPKAGERNYCGSEDCIRIRDRRAQTRLRQKRKDSAE